LLLHLIGDFIFCRGKNVYFFKTSLMIPFFFGKILL